MKLINLCIIGLILVASSNLVRAQITSVNVQSGFGIIEGNIPSTYSWNVSAAVDLRVILIKEINLRVSFLFGQDINGLLPDDRISKYYPSIKGASVKILAEQLLTEFFFIEEGIGVLMLNDKTFIDRDEIAYGVIFSGIIGYKLSKETEDKSGFSIGIGGEYGITLTNTTPSIGSTFFFLKYSF
ncbi:MAG: hypothetical protein Q8N03_12320 [Ignavibacteria bacterium]|jgi:hypothetical protein|nr:hypothetical protein [Ignavibacteria bacterium]MDP3831007.1 hypothetical protein [Ignavibacteriaceae bacterium]